MTLGHRIIGELGARGMRGMFFDCRGYCELRRVDDLPSLRRFFDRRGYRGVPAANDPVEVVDALASHGECAACTWALLLADPLFWLCALLLR